MRIDVTSPPPEAKDGTWRLTETFLFLPEFIVDRSNGRELLVWLEKVLVLEEFYSNRWHSSCWSPIDSVYFLPEDSAVGNRFVKDHNSRLEKTS